MFIQSFKQFVCETIFKHPHIKVNNLEVNTDKLDNVVCICMLCGKTFMTDKKGIRKYLGTHYYSPDADS